MSPANPAVHVTTLPGDSPADARIRLVATRPGPEGVAGSLPKFGGRVFGHVGFDKAVFPGDGRSPSDLETGWAGWNGTVGWTGIRVGSGAFREIPHKPVATKPTSHARIPPLSDERIVGRLGVVGAARSGNPPGTPFEFDATRESLPVDCLVVSTHAFGLPRAIGSCRVLGPSPGRVVVMGIEGRNAKPGCGLCPDIRKTADALADRLKTELRTGLEPGPQRGNDGAQRVDGRYSERST